MPLVPFLVLQLATGEIVAPSRELREAQSGFEFVRRNHLPILNSGVRCDVRVGRFCYWYDSSPPPKVVEAPAIRAARDRLLRTLDSAARELPADPWIAGQRVRYLLDASRISDAVRLECAAEAWWCHALRGLALHVSEDYARAASEFSVALDAMPPPLRCQWADVRALLETALAHELEEASCAERERMAARLWRLAQPLWMTGGSDMRTEYLARRTLDIVLGGSVTANGSRWGSDTRELLARYGWSETYTREPPNMMSNAAWSLTGHGREPSWNLVPAIGTLHDKWIERGDWDLRAPLARMRYAPRHLSALHDLPHQLVRLPRGDSMVVAVKLFVPDVMRDDDLRSAFAYARETSVLVVMTENGRAFVMLPRDTTLVSVEARARESKLGARARYSIAPLACSAVCMSDLLLFAPDGRDSLTLIEALDRSIPPEISGDSVGIWWEMHAPSGTPLSVRLTFEPMGRNRFRRLTDALRLTRSRSVTRLRWETVSRSGETVNQLVLRLPPAAAGTYRLSMTTTAAGEEVTAARLIQILP